MNVKTISAPKAVYCGHCGSPTHHAHKPFCRRPRRPGGKPLHGTVRKARFSVTIDPDVAEHICALNKQENLSLGIAMLWDEHREHHRKA